MTQRQVAEHEAAHTVMRYVYGRQTPGCVRRFRHVTIEKIEKTGKYKGVLEGLFSSWMDSERVKDASDERFEHQNAGFRRQIEHAIMVSWAGGVWDDMHDVDDQEVVKIVDGHEVYAG